jgi:hypothetical protein
MSPQQPMQDFKELETFQRLSETVAHDINNLLSGILGYCELLMSEPVADGLKPYIGEISDAGRRIASLIHILLVFGDKYISHAETFNLNNVISEIEKLTPRILGSGLHFNTIKDPGLWPVRADPARMKLALIALAIEMQKLMPGDGKIVLSTGNLLDTSSASEGSLVEPLRYALVTATSSGKIAETQTPSYLLQLPTTADAVAAEDAPRGIFDLDELVKMSGGRIWLESLSTQELVVRLRLPAVSHNLRL